MLDLPDDIIRLIAQELSVLDSFSLLTTCKEMSRILTKNFIYKKDNQLKPLPFEVDSNFTRITINDIYKFEDFNFQLCVNGRHLDMKEIVTKYIKFSYQEVELNVGNYTSKYQSDNYILKLDKDAHLNLVDDFEKNQIDQYYMGYLISEQSRIFSFDKTIGKSHDEIFKMLIITKNYIVYINYINYVFFEMYKVIMTNGDKITSYHLDEKENVLYAKLSEGITYRINLKNMMMQITN